MIGSPDPRQRIQRWIEHRTAEILDCEYFHLVFTVPADIAAIAFQNKAQVYGILFHAELSPRTFCTFLREFPSFGRQGQLRESDADPGQGAGMTRSRFSRAAASRGTAGGSAWSERGAALTAAIQTVYGPIAERAR